MNSDLALYYFQTVVFGFLTGFVIGYVFKKISKFIIILLGIILILQILVFNGIIDIDWGLIKSVTKPIYSNKGVILDTLKRIFLINIPFAVSAGLGFLLGLKKG